MSDAQREDISRRARADYDALPPHERPRYARVQATMGRESWRRNARHTAKLGGLTGYGTSQAAALADLAGKITAAVKRPESQPDGVTFWHDAANGMLWVAVPDVLNGGADEYAVDLAGGYPSNPRRTGWTAYPARDALGSAVGMAPLAHDHQLPPMPAEVREMLSRAEDARAWLAGYPGRESATEAELANALSDLADYVSGLYAPSELSR